jgi:hypothetical protein
MAQYMINFTRPISDNITLFGFKICDNKQASLYLHCVDLLTQEDAKFDIGNDEINYSNDDFELIKITNTETKLLCKLFDLDYLNESSIIGIFPDAINDAYELGLTDDDNDDEIDNIDEF